MRKIIALMICILFFAGSNDAELILYEEDVEPTIGDFFQYEMVGNYYPDNLGNAIDEENYLRVENYDGNGMRIEVTDKGQTSFEGETVDYFAMMMTWDTSFTLYFDDAWGDGDGKEDTIEVSNVFSSEIWQINEDLFGLNTTDIKQTNKNDMKMIMTLNEYEEQTVIIGESIEEVVIELLSTSNNQPNGAKVGDVWTMSTTERTTGTSRDRTCEENDEDCEWEIEEIDLEETVTSTSEVLTEVSVKTMSAGTFEALEIKDIEEGEDSGNYTLMYVSDTGLPIKMMLYSEGELSMNSHLESYRVSAWGVCENCPSLEEDTDGLLGDLPALPFLMSLATIALIAHRNRLQ